MQQHTENNREKIISVQLLHSQVLTASPNIPSMSPQSLNLMPCSWFLLSLLL